jgi:hypothetical protein
MVQGVSDVACITSGSVRTIASTYSGTGLSIETVRNALSHHPATV